MARGRKKELVSLREYARRRGISHVAVHKAIKAGRISTVDGKIDPARADRIDWWRLQLVEKLTGRPEGFSDGERLIPNRPYASVIPGTGKP